MRHPFWSWTGWLSLSLAGCLHGNDVRQATLRKVADRTESVAVSPIVGPSPKPIPTETAPTQPAKPWGRWFGKSAASQSQKVPASPKTSAAKKVIETPLANVARSPAAPASFAPPLSAGIVQAQHTVPTTRPAAQASPASNGNQRSGITPPTQPALLPDTAARPLSPSADVRSPAVPPIAPEVLPEVPMPALNEPQPFAEFERAIPLSPVDASKPRPAASATEMEIRPQPLFPAPSQPATAPATPKKELSEPPQESPIVSDTATAPRAADSSARPRDVALMIDQIFDDLRQHRLSVARARTEQLKRLIDGRSPVDELLDLDNESDDSTTGPESSELLESQLGADANAAAESNVPAAKELPEKFFDDEEPLND